MFTLDFYLLMSVNSKWDEYSRKTLYILYNICTYKPVNSTPRVVSSRYLSLSFGTVRLHPLNSPGGYEWHLQGSPESS